MSKALQPQRPFQVVCSFLEFTCLLTQASSFGRLWRVKDRGLGADRPAVEGCLPLLYLHFYGQELNLPVWLFSKMKVNSTYSTELFWGLFIFPVKHLTQSPTWMGTQQMMLSLLPSATPPFQMLVPGVPLLSQPPSSGDVSPLWGSPF